MSDISSRWPNHREAVALFYSGEAALGAVDVLQSHGVDQARISILGRGGDEEASAGGGSGAVGDFLRHRLGGGLREPYVTECLAHGGVVLWVLIGTDDEREVAHLLHKAGSSGFSTSRRPPR